jgi:hypothetical protein
VRDLLESLKQDFDETAAITRSVLETNMASDDGRIQCAVRRLQIPYLSILLVGGTQVGKSTLLNALAGQSLSEVGLGAATTSNAVFYTPVDILEEDLPFKVGQDARVAHRVEGLAGKVIIDAPDCDSFRPENKRRSLELLERADVVLVVTSWEKYNQMSLHSLLQPEIRGRSEASFVFAVNKLDELEPSEETLILEDFTKVLNRLGIQAPTIFPISAQQAFEARSQNRASPRWLQRLSSLEAYLQEKLDRKLKGSNLAQEVSTGLDRLVEGGQGGSTIQALSCFVEAVDSADMEFRESLRKIVEDVLESHQSGFLATFRGIVGERIAGGFGTYLTALTYLRPSRFTMLLARSSRKSGEEALLDSIAVALSSRLSRMLVDGLSSYFRRLKVAGKTLRDGVRLSEPIRDALDAVSQEPLLSPDVLAKQIRPTLQVLTNWEVRPWIGRVLNFPFFMLLHAAPIILVYQYLTRLDPEKVVMWLVTLPFVVISLLEVERFLYESLWLSRVAKRRVRSLAAAVQEGVVEALGNGALASPRKASREINNLLERHRAIGEKLLILKQSDQR